MKIIPINNIGELQIDSLEKLVSKKTKIISVTHISNTLGTINPIKKIIELAHLHNAYIVIDGAQAIAHTPVDVQSLDCDFYTFSGHKLYGPTGIGVLYGKEDLLKKLPPYQFGGEMILKVTFEKTSYNTLPYKFEAGTPNISGSIGLSVAIDYLDSLPIDLCHQHEMEIHDYALDQLESFSNIRLVGASQKKSTIISFVVKDIHPHDVGTILNQKGVAVRTGHHCTMPLMEFFNISGTIRASFSFYNTKNEVERFADALGIAFKMLS